MYTGKSTRKSCPVAEKAAYCKRPIWIRPARGIALAFVLLGVGVLIYSLYLSVQIEKHFSGRRWSIPSKVFSDTTILYPGQGINKDSLYKKLWRLGYRRVYGTPDCKGEVRIYGPFLEIFLHDLDLPWRKREGFLARIHFAMNCIESIERLDNGQPAPILELEPEEVGQFFGREREQRRLISIEQVPKHLICSVLAAEDSRFYKHQGIDIQSILRALYVNIRHGSIRQGGSTLTQQLARSYFLTPVRTFSRKIKELLMAIIIEAIYTKDDIIEIYLNEIYLGQKGSVSINGIGEASFFYFGKPFNRLSLAEAATIAGLIKSPGMYSPYVSETRCRERRNKILRDMEKIGSISTEQLKTALMEPIKAVGLSKYERKAPYFVDYLSKRLTAMYSTEILSSQGLSIFTTLDMQVQMAAEKALERGLVRIEKAHPSLKRSNPGRRLQGAIIAMQPKTGYILAMVGGRDYGTSQFNRITQAHRQPGSAFKPFIYLAGLEQFTPATLLSNKPRLYGTKGKFWVPHGNKHTSEIGVRMRDALAKSDNLATVDLAMKVGLDHIVNKVNDFRFSTPIEPQPSLALGAYEVIPLELASAYCTFASDGEEPYPLSIKSIVDDKKNVLKRKHMLIRNIISPAQAFVMSDMLRSVIRGGTGKALTHLGVNFPVAGKTGTTNDYRDAWFVGYTPDFLALVWVGFDNGDSISVEGSVAALPIWADFVREVPHRTSFDWFIVPPDVAVKTICSKSGLLALNGCPEPIEEVFITETVPNEYCQIPEHLFHF